MLSGLCSKTCLVRVAVAAHQGALLWLSSAPPPPHLALLRRAACLSWQVTEGMQRALPLVVAGELRSVGSVALHCCPGEHEPIFTLERFAGRRVTQLVGGSAQPPPAARGSAGGSGASGSGSGGGGGAGASAPPPAPQRPAQGEDRPAGGAGDRVGDEPAADGVAGLARGAADGPTTPVTPPSGLTSGMATPAGPPLLGANAPPATPRPPSFSPWEQPRPAAPAATAAPAARPRAAPAPTAPAPTAPPPSKQAGVKAGKGGASEQPSPPGVHVDDLQMKPKGGRVRDDSCGKLASIPHNTLP